MHMATLEVSNGGVGNLGSVAEAYEGYLLARASSGMQFSEWLVSNGKKEHGVGCFVVGLWCAR
jgi:hypothetical protein